MSTMIEKVGTAIEDAGVGYSIQLVSLVDGISIYQLTDSDRGPALHFSSHSSASEYIQEKNKRLRARAAIEAMREPTEGMLVAGAKSRTAPDRFETSDDTLGPEWHAMLHAALTGETQP